MSQITLSYSKKDMFETCKYRYYLHYEKREKPSDKVISLVSGGLIHDAIAKAEQNGKNLLEIYTKLAEAEKGFTNLPEYSLGLDLIGNWQEWKGNRPKDEIIKGIELFFRFFTPSGIVFIAKVDRISYLPSKDLWIITDYKTGKSKVPKNKVKNNLQLNAYILGFLTKNKVPVEKVRAEFLYLRDLDIRGVNGDEAETSTIEKDIEKTYHKMIKEKGFPRNEGWQCKFCEYYSLCDRETGQELPNIARDLDKDTKAPKLRLKGEHVDVCLCPLCGKDCEEKERIHKVGRCVLFCANFSGKATGKA